MELCDVTWCPKLSSYRVRGKNILFFFFVLNFFLCKEITIVLLQEAKIEEFDLSNNNLQLRYVVSGIVVGSTFELEWKELVDGKLVAETV
jgi:hypothetical protein